MYKEKGSNKGHLFQVFHLHQLLNYLMKQTQEMQVHTPRTKAGCFAI